MTQDDTSLAIISRNAAQAQYDSLSAPFDVTFTDVRGGAELTYVTGEQVISRLNDVLGVAGWSFNVLRHDIHLEADEIWVHGQFTAWLEDGHGGIREIQREQFGSQKLRRSRSTSMPLDIGFDLKGATTDCLKKCAMGVGVGLYLSQKKAQPKKQPQQQRQSAQRPQQQAPQQRESRPAATQSSSAPVPICEECGEALKPMSFISKKPEDAGSTVTWDTDKLVSVTTEKYGVPLCERDLKRHIKEEHDEAARPKAAA